MGKDNELGLKGVLNKITNKGKRERAGKKNRVARVWDFILGQLQKQFDYSYRYLLITETVMFNSPTKGLRSCELITGHVEIK